MISLSHWGMFSDFRPLMLPKGFKLSAAALAEWNKPHAIVEMVHLAKGEAQPVYVAPDLDCA